MLVSGIRGATIVRQDFSQLSAILGVYYPIVESPVEANDVLIETMPDQVVRQRYNGLSFYYGIEPPKNPPFTLLLKYSKLPLMPQQTLEKPMGYKKCYLSRVEDEPYFKDGDVFLFATPSQSFYVHEITAYVKRFNHNVFTYFDELPTQIYDCGEIVPTNEHAKVIVDVMNRNLTRYVRKEEFEKKIYSFFAQL